MRQRKKSLGEHLVEQGLTAHIAFGYHQAILRRIPPQDMELPLPLHTQNLLRCLAETGCRTLAEPLAPKPLDAFLDDAADLMSSSGIRGFLRRLELAWLYAAHRLARLNPGMIALLRGDVFGPYRSETSYLTVSEKSLWASARKVHDAVFHVLGLRPPENRYTGRADVFIGKQAASLEALAGSANAILDESGADNLPAFASWVLQFHGRRPTADLPHPAVYAVQTGAGAAFFLADKNLGGGRRVRVVPTTQAGFDAAMAVRRTK